MASLEGGPHGSSLRRAQRRRVQRSGTCTPLALLHAGLLATALSQPRSHGHVVLERRSPSPVLRRLPGALGGKCLPAVLLKGRQRRELWGRGRRAIGSRLRSVAPQPASDPDIPAAPERGLCGPDDRWGKGSSEEGRAAELGPERSSVCLRGFPARLAPQVGAGAGSVC